MSLTRSTIWVDFQGNTQQTIMSTSTGASSIETAVLNASHASRKTEWEGTPGGASGTAVNAVYVSVYDYALIEYTCADGTTVSLAVPAPRAAVFTADGESVNNSNSFVTAITTAVVGNLLSASGSAASAILGGVRRHRNRGYV